MLVLDDSVNQQSNVETFWDNNHINQNITLVTKPQAYNKKILKYNNNTIIPSRYNEKVKKTQKNFRTRR